MAGGGNLEDGGLPGPWRQLVSGGGLVLAVGAVLVAGALLETEGTRTATRPAPSFSEAPAEAASAEPEPILDPVSRRTLEDPVRLARTVGPFTLQLAVACRKETAERLLGRVEGAGDLYILPAVAKGQECFRICWGSFDSKEAALRAPRPAALRGPDFRDPAPRRIRELTP